MAEQTKYAAKKMKYQVNFLLECHKLTIKTNWSRKKQFYSFNRFFSRRAFPPYSELFRCQFQVGHSDSPLISLIHLLPCK